MESELERRSIGSCLYDTKTGTILFYIYVVSHEEDEDNKSEIWIYKDKKYVMLKNNPDSNPLYIHNDNIYYAAINKKQINIYTTDINGGNKQTFFSIKNNLSIENIGKIQVTSKYILLDTFNDKYETIIYLFDRKGNQIFHKTAYNAAINESGTFVWIPDSSSLKVYTYNIMDKTQKSYDFFYPMMIDIQFYYGPPPSVFINKQGDIAVTFVSYPKNEFKIVLVRPNDKKKVIQLRYSFGYENGFQYIIPFLD